MRVPNAHWCRVFRDSPSETRAGGGRSVFEKWHAHRQDASAWPVFAKRPIIHNEWGGSGQAIRLPLLWVIVTLRSSEAGSARPVWSKAVTGQAR